MIRYVVKWIKLDDIIDRYLTYFLLKYNWKQKTWKVVFGRQSLGAQTTDLPNGLNTSLEMLVFRKSLRTLFS